MKREVDLLIIIRIKRREAFSAPFHGTYTALTVLRPALGVYFCGTDATSLLRRSLTCRAELGGGNTVIPFVPKLGIVRMFPEGVALVRCRAVEGAELPHEAAGRGA